MDNKFSPVSLPVPLLGIAMLLNVSAHAEPTPANTAAVSLPELGRPNERPGSLTPHSNGVTLESSFDGKKVILAPEYSQRTGLSLGAALAAMLGDNAAVGVLLSAGADQQELLLNAGFQPDDRQRVIVSAGQLRQFLDYTVRTGTEKAGMTQNSAAASYELRLGKEFLQFLEINGYLADTASRELDGKTFAIDTATLYELWNDPRRIAGGKITGLQARLGFAPVPGGLVKVSLGRERLSYDLLTGQDRVTRVTGGAEWQQQLGGYQLKLSADSFASQHRYALGLEQSPDGTPHRFGLSLVGLRGRDGLGNDNQIRLTYSYAFGSHASAHPQARATSAPAPSAPAPSWSGPGLLDQVAQRPAFLPAQVVAKLDTSAVPVRLTAVSKTTLPAGTSVNPATGAVTAPLGVTIADILGVTLNGAAFANSGQFSLTGNNLVIDPNKIAQPAVGAVDTYVVTVNNSGGGTTLITVKVSHGSVKIDSITVAAGDSTAPATTAAPSVSGTSDSATTLSAAINEAGTGYYLVQAAAAAAPTAAAVIAANHGFAMTANTAASVNITGLTASTAYKIYFVAKDTANNVQAAVQSASATTTAIPAPAVTADDTNNLIVLGGGAVAANLEVSVDGGAYAAYSAATAYGGNHSVKVRVKAMNGNPAGEDTTLSFTEGPPAAPAVTADDTNNVIVPGSGAVAANLEVSVDGGAYAAYSSATVYAGNKSVKVRVKAMSGNPVGADTTLSFTEVAPAAPNVSANDDSDVIVLGSGVSGANLEVSLDGGAYAAYSASASYSGSHTVKVRTKAMNGNPAGADATLSFTEPPPVNNPPTANNVFKSNVGNQTKSLSCLTDASANDLDNDTMTCSVTGAPSHGTLLPAGGNNFTYTPNAGYTGNDTATVRILDGNGGTVNYTVTFNGIDTQSATYVSTSAGPWAAGSGGNGSSAIFGAAGYPSSANYTLTFSENIDTASASCSSGNVNLTCNVTSVVNNQVSVTVTMTAATTGTVVVSTKDRANGNGTNTGNTSQNASMSADQF